MNKRCKYLITNTKGWGKKLYEACYNLESFVEGLDGFVKHEDFRGSTDGYSIYNSFSDFQPSYIVMKQEGNKRFCYKVDPIIVNGIQIYRVEDEINTNRRLWQSAPAGTNSITMRGNPPGSIFNPYYWDFNTLKSKIKNIDVSNGFAV